MTIYLPRGIRQNVVVEVYLPKNLLNSGALTELLTHTIEFNYAHKCLIDDCERLYNSGTLLFKLNTKYEEALSKNNASELKRPFELYDCLLTGNMTILDEQDIYWLEINDVKKYYIKKDDLTVYETGILKEHFSSLAAFEQRIKAMEKTIIGYSIYEVDGAFESTDKGRPIPVKVFNVQREFIRELENSKVDNIKKVFNDNNQSLEEYLFSLNKEYGECLKNGLVDAELKYAFNAKGHFLSDEATITKIRGEYWEIKDKKDTKDYLLDASGQELKVYLDDVRISSGERNYWEISAGNKIYKIEDTDTELTVYRCVRLVEERTLVIRFITNLEIGSDYPSILVSRKDVASQNGKIDDEILNKAYKKLWDTITLIGQYFANNLGSRVQIEDEIWICYDVGYSWVWKKGQLVYKQRP